MSEVKKESFKNSDNFLQCECGNWAHHKYIRTDNEGSYTCPNCMISWLNDQLNIYKKVLKSVENKEINISDAENKIKEEYCNLMCISIQDFDDLEINL